MKREFIDRLASKA